MNANEYQRLSAHTEAPINAELRVRIASHARLLHGAIGLCTEAGEFQDQLKRAIYYNKPLDTVNLIEELGDVTYYVALLANALGVGLEDVFDSNHAKLKARYPNKFCETAAVVRDVNAERQILETHHG